MPTEYLTFIADFAVENRFAYLSHQETLSFWQRVLVRAHLPLVFSQGFNPRPRLSLPLPRSVGVQSDCERFCTRVASGGFCEEASRRAIAELLPEGCTLLDTQTAFGKAAFYPVSATYRFTLSAAPDAVRREHFEHCIRQLQIHEPVVLSRRMEKGRQRPFDIQPFVKSLSMDDFTVNAVCAVLPQGSVRVDELLRWLNLEPDDLAEPVRRISVQWVSNTKHFQGKHN